MAGNSIYIENNRRLQTVDAYLVVREYGKDNRLISKYIGDFAKVEAKEGIAEQVKPFRLSTEEAQVLFDQLWDCGLRPAENKAAEYRAQAKHLEDMRALAFGKLGVAKP